MTWAAALDLWRIGRDGFWLAIAASALIMGALRFNPRLFLRHFPENVRRTQPPLSPAEMRVGRVVGFALIALLVVVPVWSARTGAATRGYGVFDTFLHAFLVGMAANLTDWLILDELWIGLGRPEWALPPGVTQTDVPFDHGQHARGFRTGTVLCAVVGIVAALVVRIW